MAVRLVSILLSRPDICTLRRQVRGANDQRYVLRLDPATTDHHDEAMASKRKCRGLTALAVEVVGCVSIALNGNLAPSAVICFVPTVACW